MVTIRTVIALLAHAGALEGATVLLAAAQSARTGAPSFGVDVATMRDTAEQLRSALGDDRFDRYIEPGRLMSEEEALPFAIEALERAAKTCPRSSDRVSHASHNYSPPPSSWRLTTGTPARARIGDLLGGREPRTVSQNARPEVAQRVAPECRIRARVGVVRPPVRRMAWLGTLHRR